MYLISVTLYNFLSPFTWIYFSSPPFLLPFPSLPFSLLLSTLPPVISTITSWKSRAGIIIPALYKLAKVCKRINDLFKVIHYWISQMGHPCQVQSSFPWATLPSKLKNVSLEPEGKCDLITQDDSLSPSNPVLDWSNHSSQMPVNVFSLCSI